MQWVLIIIVLSSWDSKPVDWYYVAKYNSKVDCEEARDQLIKTAKLSRYICANDVVDRAANPQGGKT